tara:strand:- start:282 stop:545 length:264 start_codon:yes stop_codon:yes gene_type:complete
MKKQKTKTRNQQLRVNLSLEELNIIKSKIEFYKKQGVKLNRSKLVRDLLLNIEDDYKFENNIIKDKPKNVNRNKDISLFWGLIKIQN